MPVMMLSIPRIMFAACCLSLASPLYAGRFEVSPIRVSMEQQKQKSTSITVKNTAAEPLQIQVKSFSWENSLLESNMSPSNELVVSPPIVSIAPNQSQVLRIFWRGVPNLKVERAYRLSITEVPSTKPSFKNGVSTYLQFSIPVFVRPNASAASKIVWRMQPPSSVLSEDAKKDATQNTTQLVLENTGDAHALLGTIQMTQDANWVDFQKGPNYILANQKRSWALPKTIDPQKNLQLRLRYETGKIEDVLVPVPSLP